MQNDPSKILKLKIMKTSIKPISEKYLYNYGIYYLKKFPSPIGHFKKLMSQKIERSYAFFQSPPLEECFEMLEKVIHTLIKQGFLNDSLYLEGSLTSYKSKGLSNKMIRFKLEQKGISKAIINELPQIYSEDDDLKRLIIIMKKKKMGPYATEIIKEQKIKHISYLARNGFSLEVVQKGLNLSIDDCQNLLEDI